MDAVSQARRLLTMGRRPQPARTDATVSRLAGSKKSTWPATVNGYDLHTGQVKKKVPLGNIFKTHHHHRCYRNKATTRYILASRRGTEFVDLEQGRHTVHNWVRGTCHMGMMPANGLQYAPPHPCQCYIDEKLNAFNALSAASKKSNEKADERQEPLEKGPAYSSIRNQQSSIINPKDWPTFRGCAARSGASSAVLPNHLTTDWRVSLSASLTAPTVAAGRVFVAAVDRHEIIALHLATGREQSCSASCPVDWWRLLSRR